MRVSHCVAGLRFKAALAEGESPRLQTVHEKHDNRGPFSPIQAESGISDDELT